jgi:hypothetical protein
MQTKLDCDIKLHVNNFSAFDKPFIHFLNML